MFLIQQQHCGKRVLRAGDGEAADVALQGDNLIFSARVHEVLQDGVSAATVVLGKRNVAKSGTTYKGVDGGVDGAVVVRINHFLLVVEVGENFTESGDLGVLETWTAWRKRRRNAFPTRLRSFSSNVKVE